jgi:hypothetical protein
MLERKDVGINTARWSARRRYRIWHSLGLAVERQLAHAAARPVASSSIPLRREMEMEMQLRLPVQERAWDARKRESKAAIY